MLCFVFCCCFVLFQFALSACLMSCRVVVLVVVVLVVVVVVGLLFVVFGSCNLAA